MVVPFQVSVGDFVSTLGLVRKIVAALAESYGSGHQFRSLLVRLHALESALTHLEDITWNDESFGLELGAVTEDCKKSIALFESKLSKFHPSLRLGGSSNKWKDALRKVQYTFIRDEVTNFQTELGLHLTCVQLLLGRAGCSATVDMGIMARQVTTRLSAVEHQVSTIRASQQIFHTVFYRCAAEIKDLLVVIFNVLAMSLGRQAGSLPYGIPFQKPLILQDACGKYYPVHIEWTSCWEAFHEMLRRQFENRPGEEAVKARHYKLQDASTPGKWSEVDIETPYDEVYQSDGRWDMAMVFPRDQETDTGCPKCGSAEDIEIDPSRIECSNEECLTFYSRADDLWCEILVYPTHFQMPANVSTVQDTAYDRDIDQASDTSSEDQTLDSQDVDLEASDSAEDFDDCPRHGPDIIDTSALGEVCIDDFQNLYLAKSPSVYLMDLSGCWHGLPWPLFRTFEGFQFFARFLLKASRSSRLAIVDWSSGDQIVESDWEERTYIGMVANMVLLEEEAIRRTNRNFPNGSTLSCRLCHKRYFSKETLIRHATSHFRQVPCPGDCNICQEI